MPRPLTPGERALRDVYQPLALEQALQTVNRIDASLGGLHDAFREEGQLLRGEVPLPEIAATEQEFQPPPLAMRATTASPNPLTPSSNIAGGGFGWPQALMGIGAALEGFGAGFHGHPPYATLGLLERNLRERQLVEQAAERRQMMAFRLEQVQEQKRQHDLQMIEKLMATGNSDALIEYGKANPESPALLIGQSISKQDLADVVAGVKEGLIPDDFLKRVMDKQVTPSELRARAKVIVEARTLNAKEEAKAHILQQALNTPTEQRTPYQRQLVEEHEAASELKRADIDLKKAQAAKANMEAQRGPIDHSVLNRVHEQITNKLQGHPIPFDLGNADTQKQALDEYWRGNAQGRLDVAGITPVGQSGKAQEFRDPVTGKAAPSWAVPSKLQELGYVNIEPTQAAVVNQLRNTDEALKEILVAGNTLLRKSGGSWTDIPKGMLQTPIVNLITKYKGDPDAQLLNSAIIRIAPTLSRLGGDVANIAVAEREMYIQSIFNPADTLESFAKKIASIEAANARTRESLGFLPDEKSYIRQLVIRGMTDAQIKAALEERKRYQ